MSSGKSLYMAALLYNQWRRGRTIITNFDINIPHYEINRDVLFYLGENNISLPNVAFGLDELWIWLDARDAMINKVATYFFLQSSKDDTNIYLTSQDNSQNEQRLRNNMHYLTSCKRVIYEDDIFKTVLSKKRILPPEMTEKLYIELTMHEKRNYYIYSEFIPLPNHGYLRTKKFIPLYDTTQKIRRKDNAIKSFNELITAPIPISSG